ncbi:MAG: peptidoglycan DD-metalloendopeptidase family protein [Clostridia bacterium]|nr:peptidoglycan DD-metalloendopeptidase family protein [Clostridia bacterium]
MKKLRTKIVATLLISMVIMQYSIISLAATKSQLKSQQSTLNSKIKETQANLKEIKAEKSSAMKEVENLISQISEYESEIDKLNDQISQTTAKINEAQSNLNKTIEEYDEQERLLNERLVLMYETGETSYLDFMLSSKGLTDFISNYYLVSELTQYDSELLEQIQAKKQSIEEQKASLENSKKELDTTKASKEQKQTQIKNAKASKDAAVAKLSSEEKSTQQELEQFEADKKAITSELSRIAAEEAASRGGSYIPGAPSSSGYIFPVAGCSKSNIANKSYPSYRGHTGVDVNIGVVGKTVVAVKAGTVAISTALRSSSGGYRSYGEYVVINHHNGTMTLYAHMLAGSRRVSAGQSVSQGQAIGTVGSTGNSTGTHLHFEVRINGSPVNPIPYLP